MSDWRWPALLLVTAIATGCTSSTAGVAEIVLSGELHDGEGPLALSGPRPASLRATLQLFQELGRDEEVEGVLVRIGGLGGGPARIGEVLDGLNRLRDAGPMVHCHLEEASNYTMWLAAAGCDHVTVSPAATIALLGLATESYYLRELLELVGAEGDFLRVGSHKGAAEIFTLDDMSPETRETLDDLLDDLSALLLDGLSTGRRLDDAAIRDVIDRAPFDGEDAREAGLVDAVGYHDEALDTLREAIPGDAPVLERFHASRVERSSDGLSRGLLEGRRPDPSGPRVAVLYLSGPIIGSGEDPSVFGDRIALPRVRRALQEIREDEDLDALVVRIESPGGSAAASDEIWHEVEAIRATRPVVASLGDVAASGGYYIAVGADEIFAQPGTITGSIGVVGGKLVFGDLFDRAGVRSVILTRGRNAGLFTLSRPFTPSQRQALQRHLVATYERFVGCVTAGRGLPEARVRSLATGRVWTGRRARDLGLVDELGGLHEAIARARELAGLPDEAPVEAFPKPLPLLSRLERAMHPPSLAAALADAASPGPNAALVGRAVEIMLLSDREHVLTYWPGYLDIR